MNKLAGVLALGTAGAAVQEDRRAQVEMIQNTPGVLWTAAATPRFASGAPGVSKRMLGVKGDWKANIEAAIARGDVERFQPLTAMLVPTSFDSEENWPHCAKIIGDIRDQSNCGCCWAFGAAEAASDRMCIASNATLMLPISAQDVCFTSSDDGCDGGDITSPWDYISKQGAVTGGQYQGTGPFGKGLCSDFSLPHCHHHGPQGDDPYPAEGAKGCPSASSPEAPKKCDAAAASPHSDFANDKYTFSGRTSSASGPSAIKQAIMAGGPVETAFTVYTDFENYVGGVYHHVTGSMAGGHAVKIVGWGVDSGTKYWKVANSWNPHWGEKGYFRIKEGEGGIDDHVTFSPASATWSTKGANAGATDDVEWGCQGSGDPVAATCYEGSAGALGVKETVKVNLKKYATGAGSLDLTGTGVKGFTCSDHAFTKSGQDVSVDLSDCLPSGITVPKLKYCSSSDTIAVTVKDKAVPIPISTTLKKVTCSSTIVV